MKSKENQHVKLGSIVGVISLSLILLLMISVPWGGSWNESKTIRARQKAEVLGYQLIQLYQENLKSSSNGLKNSRSIASVDSDMVEFKPEGLMGIDPWGQPFKYSIQHVGKDQLKVMIWSTGPNQRDDNNESQSENKLYSENTDDIQIVLNVPASSN